MDRAIGNIYGRVRMWIAKDKFAKIDPNETVDKLNKSKLTENVNVNKMVLQLVSCWWWTCWTQPGWSLPRPNGTDLDRGVEKVPPALAG